MITKDDVRYVMGKKLVGPEGDKIGTIDTVYLDDETDQPEFALVNTGLLGTRSSFVPLHDAELGEDAVRVPYSKDQVKDAPDIDADEHIAESEEQELFRYYGIDSAGRTRSDAGDLTTDRGRDMGTGTGLGADTGTRDRGTVGRDVSGPTTDDAMTRSEEELHVSKQRQPSSRVRLRKHVETEHVTKTVPVQREEVHLEREPITEENRDRAMDGPAISEEEHEVTLMQEEPVVEKRAVPKERVRLEKDQVTEERQVSEDVRREEIDVDDDDRRRS